jgi:Domain of unknown function (DUF4389)
VEFKRDRNRLTTLVQPLLALPQYLVLLVATVPLCLVVFYVWFALLFTARWPSAPYRWIVGWLRAATRLWGYLNIVSSRYPPWTTGEDPSYEVRLSVGPPKHRYSRLRVLFRFLLVIPAYLAGAVGGMLLSVVLILSWVVIVITGHQAESLFRLQRVGLGWFALYGLMVNLVIEDYDWALSGGLGSS